MQEWEPPWDITAGNIRAQQWGIQTGIEMGNKTLKIPEEVLKEIFPKKSGFLLHSLLRETR